METFAVYGLGHDEGDQRNRIKGPGVPGKRGFAMMGDAMPRWLTRLCRDLLETDEVNSTILHFFIQHIIFVLI